MKIVLVHPITRAPIAIEPQYGQPMYFEGKYQNCAIVSNEYAGDEAENAAISAYVNRLTWQHMARTWDELHHAELAKEYNHKHETSREDPQ